MSKKGKNIFGVFVAEHPTLWTTGIIVPLVSERCFFNCNKHIKFAIKHEWYVLELEKFQFKKLLNLHCHVCHFVK